MAELEERPLGLALMFVVLVGVANTTFHALAANAVFSLISGTASIVAAWAIWRIFWAE